MAADDPCAWPDFEERRAKPQRHQALQQPVCRSSVGGRHPPLRQVEGKLLDAMDVLQRHLDQVLL